MNTNQTNAAVYALIFVTVFGLLLALTACSSKPTSLELLILKHKLERSRLENLMRDDYETCFYKPTPAPLAGSYCLRDGGK